MLFRRKKFFVSTGKSRFFIGHKPPLLLTIKENLLLEQALCVESMFTNRKVSTSFWQHYMTTVEYLSTCTGAL